MRITNSIMLNTQKSNINANKVFMDTIHTQMSTQKKINKPSDDPIIAVRSLRLRANLAELTQYADRNIEDAMSWMEVTESAMENMRAILKDMYENNYETGANGTLNTAQSMAIVENLEALANKFYEEGNSAYAGRTLFTGYKTNSDFLYKQADPDAKFNISETFNVSQFVTRDYISNSVTVDRTNLQTVPQANFPETDKVTVFNLTYTGMDEINSLTYVDSNGNPQRITFNNCQLTVDGDAAYTPRANEVNYIKETGELVFGETIANTLSNLGSDAVITANYDKTGFLEGDINPVMYFDCVDNTDPANPITYTKERQEIKYNVGFNQKIRVNTEGSDVLLLDVKKEVASLRDAVTAVDEAEKKKADIESMLEDPRYADQKEELTSMLSAVNKEIDLKKARMVDLFKKGVGSMQEYEDHVSVYITDLGNRYSQLQMTKTRMQQQKTNFKELLTQNEDRELSDIILDYTASNYSYQLALQATGNISKLSLLNYI